MKSANRGNFSIINVDLLQDFSISEIEGDIYDARKRKMRDSDDEGDEIDEKPSKKKSKQKQKPEVKENELPGKYVLLKPQDVEEEKEEDEVDNVESAAIKTVSCVLFNYRKL